MTRSKQCQAAAQVQTPKELPEWKFGNRQPMLLEDPLLLLMAVPLRQQLNWNQQVLPALRHFTESEHAGGTIKWFYHDTYCRLAESLGCWHELALALWGRAYWRSASMLAELLIYVLSFDRPGPANREADWCRMRTAFLSETSSVVLPKVRGLGTNSWAFLVYYLTRHPPEEFVDEFSRLYGLEYGDPGEVDVRRLWLQMLQDGVLHRVNML